jgi:hypothetical protein
MSPVRVRDHRGWRDEWECRDDVACARRCALRHDRIARERRFALVLGARLRRRG